MTDRNINTVVQELQNSEERYNEILKQYTELNDQYTEAQSTDNKEEIATISAKMTQLISALGNELDQMKSILNRAYNDGETRQTLSASAGNAMEIQQSIMEQRMNHFMDARDRLEHIVGEESSSGLNVVRNRNIYYIYYIFAFALIACIIVMLFGGSLPSGIIMIFIVLGVFIGWEYYKKCLAGFGNVASEQSSKITGIFKLIV
jgi:hypothetical protein